MTSSWIAALEERAKAMEAEDKDTTVAALKAFEARFQKFVHHLNGKI